MNHLLTIFISAVLSLGSFFGIHHTQTPVALGAFNPTGGGTYRLQSSIGGSATTLTLTSFKEPISNIKYTMSYLNSSIEYATIEPQSSSKEFISFTGITQNSDGTATLTGISRGLGFSYPYTASTTLQQSHSAQSILILSNPPQLYGQYANKANDETITGQWTFSVFPITPSSPAGSETTSGILQLATGAQAAATTLSGSLGRLALSAAISTSTWNTATAGNVVPVTGLSTKVLDPKFIFPQVVASSSVLSQDGSGNISWENVSSLMAFASSSPVVFSNASSTLVSAAIPANYFGSRDSVRVTLFLKETTANDGVATILEFAYGNATTSVRISYGGANATNAVTFILKMGGASSQSLLAQVASSSPVGLYYPTTAIGTGAIDTTQAKMLLVVGKDDSGGSNSWTTSPGVVEILRQ